MKKCMFLIALAAGIASAATYHVTLLNHTIVNGTELKPGDYRLDVDNDMAVFHVGRKTVEAPVKVETAAKKTSNTTYRYGTTADGKMSLQAIQFGGSATTIVFANPSAASQSGAN